MPVQSKCPAVSALTGKEEFPMAGASKPAQLGCCSHFSHTNLEELPLEV